MAFANCRAPRALQPRVAPKCSSLAAAPCARRLVAAQAKKREVPEAAFTDLYESLYDVVAEEEPSKALPVQEQRILINSINTAEQVAKVYALLERDLAVRTQIGKLDNWGLRRGFYISLALVACKKGVPDIALRFVENAAALDAPPSFAGDLLEALAKAKVPTEVLLRIVETLKAQRSGPADKALKCAYFQLLLALKIRKQQPQLLQVYQAAQQDGVVFGKDMSQLLARLQQPVGQADSAAASQPLETRVMA